MCHFIACDAGKCTVSSSIMSVEATQDKNRKRKATTEGTDVALSAKVPVSQMHRTDSTASAGHDKLNENTV